jgi:hypothetical protein
VAVRDHRRDETRGGRVHGIGGYWLLPIVSHASALTNVLRVPLIAVQCALRSGLIAAGHRLERLAEPMPTAPGDETGVSPSFREGWLGHSFKRCGRSRGARAYRSAYSSARSVLRCPYFWDICMSLPRWGWIGAPRSLRNVESIARAVTAEADALMTGSGGAAEPLATSPRGDGQ